MLKNYFKSSLQSLIKQRRTTIINVLGLSVGMTAAVLIMFWVQNELTYDSYHPGADRIYRIKNHLTVSNGETWLWESSPQKLAPAAAAEIPEITAFSRMYDGAWTPLIVKRNGETFIEKGCMYVDSNWFDFFQYKLLSGSIANFKNDPYSVILTASRAKKLFGNSDPVGKTIVSDTVNFTVQAVLADNPTNSSFQYDIILPVAVRRTNPEVLRNDEEWGNFNYVTFLKLSKGADIHAVEKKINAVIDRQRGKERNLRTTLVSLPDMHFENDLQHSAFKHGNRKSVTIFSLLGALLLLMACINYVNLTTARASMRAKEVSIRKIVGAGRKHLFMQFLTESFLLSALSILLTFLLIQLTLPFFNQLASNRFSLSFTDTAVWKLLGITLLATTLLNGIYPAILLSSFKPLNVFRGVSVLKVKDVYLRKALVVVQFCIAVALIIGTLVIFEQMQFIQRSNSHYDKSQIASIRMPWKYFAGKKDEERVTVINTVIQDLKSQSGIMAVSIANENIINNQSLSSGGFDWDGRPKDFKPSITPLTTDAAFYKMFNLQLKEGRWYTDDPAGSKGVVLNETAVREFNLRQPVIGQRFINRGDTTTIIGIVQDFHFRSMHDKIGPMVMYNDPGSRFNLFVQTVPGQPGNAIGAMNKLWKQYFAKYPFEYTFMDDTFNKVYEMDARISKLMFVFCCIAILISALGLFGLTAFTIERKTKEIGIRKVLGANIFNIVTLLSREFVMLVLLAILIAAPVAWLLMNKWLADFAYRIELSAGIFILSAFAAITLALITVSVQAAKAAMHNPVNALRKE